MNKYADKQKEQMKQSFPKIKIKTRGEQISEEVEKEHKARKDALAEKKRANPKATNKAKAKVAAAEKKYSTKKDKIVKKVKDKITDASDKKRSKVLKSGNKKLYRAKVKRVKSRSRAGSKLHKKLNK
jgi:vacuolar-type H+-ATPase subunit E/Vma4